jgi:hypothetical protein
MANEFKHKDPGTALTQAEFIASDGTGHIFDGQAAGDVLYASSTTVLKNLAKATDGNVLELASGLPAWTASPTIGSTSWANANHAHAASNSGGTLTTLGTVGTGVWQGTAIASGYIAADAITGAKIADDAVDSEHYTDGSIDNAHLADDAVDSDEIAAGAIDTAHIADNQVTVAKIEDIARGSIIYGNASAASAELTKGSANYVLTSDGTDIAWAAAGGPDQANQTAIEDETNQDTYIPPDLIKYSPGVAKAWALYDQTGTPSIAANYNVTTIHDDGTGNPRIEWDTAFSSINYICHVISGDDAAAVVVHVRYDVGSGRNATVFEYATVAVDHTTNTDYAEHHIVAWGDQA